ncbi:MAG: FtsX-like permease family protein [Bacteroidales bacterium]|nr:FtsX-like permease family protein [Bacteroidales bacterium]
MNTISLSFKNLKAKSLNTTLNLVLFATGIFIISFLLLIKGQFEEHFEKNTGGVNLVVGAKGSPLQLILSSIYHVDYPTGNIKLSEAEKLKRNPLVKQTIPLALGDNYQGFRIVGTIHDYTKIYKGELKEGTLWKNDFEVVIGSKVAKEANLKIGDQFAGVHGFMAENNDVHNEFQYKVTGIFTESGTVLDQLILTNIGSVWHIHSHHHHHDGDVDEDEDGDHHEPGEHHEHAETADTAKEITALLVFYRNPMGAVSLPRSINKNTNMQAASPAIEMNRLYSLLGVGIQSVNLIAFIIILISGFSIFISLFNSMKERKYELALMRVVGGNKFKLFSIIVLEGLIIAALGFLIGSILSRAGMLLISSYAESNFHYSLDKLFNVGLDSLLFGLSLVVGLLASLIPAIKAMQTDISKTLAQ